jgi:hypothetical protein
MSLFTESVNRVDQKLSTQYVAMSETENPVIRGLVVGSLSTQKLGSILGQYSILPARIVEFLSIGAERLGQWPKVRKELERNIDEELGGRTGAKSHYDILQDALMREVRLEVVDTKPSTATSEFMECVKSGLLNQPEAFVAGIIYGLEASAIPELTVVAKLINHYASLIGEKAPIDVTAMSRRSEQRSDKDMGASLKLDTFFAFHLQDFEIGHRNGLENSLKCYVQDPDCRLFEAGFEYVLEAMERWWGELARPSESTQGEQLLAAPLGRRDEFMLQLG